VNIVPKSSAWVKVSVGCIPTKAVNAGPDIEPVVVLDLIMPNGKRMRDCTAAEMKKFGDVLLKRVQQFKKS
jgi:hypothetical protein